MHRIFLQDLRLKTEFLLIKGELLLGIKTIATAFRKCRLTNKHLNFTWEYYLEINFTTSELI